MNATNGNKEPAAKKATASRTAPKKSATKKGTGKKGSPPGMLSKATHMVGAVLMGAATGAVTGAVKGAVEAGGKEMGIPKEGEDKESSPKGVAEEPRGKGPKKRK